MSEAEISGALKVVVETLDIVRSGNPNGFVAPGARVKENPELEAEVNRLVEAGAALKCPRCRNYHTIHGNPMDVCDRCMLTVTQMLPELVANGLWSEVDVEEWRELCRATRDRWRAK